MDRYELYKSFWTAVDKSGTKLEGKILDLCSGHHLLSISSIYNSQQIICYEFYDKMIESLKEHNIPVVQANIRDPYFPFKSNSFNYSFSGGLPFRPATCKKDVLPKDLEDPEKFLEKITSELIRVTKKQAIIHSLLFVKYFPIKYAPRIQIQNQKESLIILDCRN